MIQAPQTQYIPQQTNNQANNNQPQTAVQQQAVTATPNPGTIYNYPTTSSYLPANSYSNGKQQYNGVNIEIINPQGVGSTGQSVMPSQIQPVIPAQYIPVQSQYNFPAQQTVTTPPAGIQQNEYMPIEQSTASFPQTMQTESSAQAQPLPAAPVQTITPQNPQTVPAPQIQTPEQTSGIMTETNNTPSSNASISPESFASRLKTDDLDAQKATIEEIAQLVKEDETAGPLLLDTQVFDALVDIVGKDTSNLEAPSPEVVELRKKDESELTDEEKVKASTLTPLDKAESNKQFALYTIAYMQERLNNELEKRNGSALDFDKLPAVETVIETVKSNPNPNLRIGALASLSHIAKPEYVNDLTEIFRLAEADEDSRVKEAAIAAKQALPGAAQETSAETQTTEETQPQEEVKKTRKELRAERKAAKQAEKEANKTEK